MKSTNIIYFFLIICYSCGNSAKQKPVDNSEIDSIQYSVENMEASNDDYSFDINTIINKDYFYSDKENELLKGNVYSTTEKCIADGNSVLTECKEGRAITKTFTPLGYYKSCLVERDDFSSTNTYSVRKYFLRSTIEGKIINQFNVSGRKIDLDFSILNSYVDFRMPESCFYDISEDFIYGDTLEQINLTKSLSFRYEYNENGKLIKRFENDLPKLKLEWGDNLISKILIYNDYGTEDQVVSVGTNINQIIVSYDSYAYYKYTFNNFGQITEVGHYYRHNGSEDELNSIRTFEYHNGLITKELLKRKQTIGDASTWIEDELFASYDEFGNIVSVSIIRRKGKSGMNVENYKFTYQYDDKDNWIEKRIYSVVKGDIEIENQICTLTRKIEYYE